MALGSDPLTLIMVGGVILIAVALILDEVKPILTPALKRYRNRLPSQITGKTFLPLIGAAILAILMRIPLVSLYLIGVGILITWYYLQRAQKRHEQLRSKQIFQLILSFRSNYQLQPSVFSTLDSAKEKVEEPLKSLIDVVVETFYLTSSPERAFAQLRARSDNVYLNQFAYILEMSESASSDAVVKALENLVERLRTHDQLRRETEASLSAITGQTAFLQVISLLVVLGVAVVPVLHTPYVSVGGQVFLIVVLTVMLAASYYIDSVVSKMAERIS